MGTSSNVRPRLPNFSRAIPLARAAGLVALMATTLAVAPDAGAEDRTSLEEAAQSQDPRVAAEALYALAERADADGAYARAIVDYRASIAKLPSNRYAPRANARVSVLEAHAEGNFAPYAELDRVRRDPALANDGAAIDALARDADAFPPGLVRIESRMVCADAYLTRLGRPRDGIPLLRSVMADEKTDPLTRSQAAHALVDAFVAAGDLEDAQTLVREHSLDAKLVHRVRALVLRRALHRTSIAVLAVLGALASASIAIAARRGTLGSVARALRSSAILALGFAAYVALAGSALASTYEHGSSTPFLVLGGALVPLLLVARAWGAAGRTSTSARVGRAVLAASSIVAAAFLVLEWMDTAYLESFGL